MLLKENPILTNRQSAPPVRSGSRSLEYLPILTSVGNLSSYSRLLAASEATLRSSS